MRGKLHLHRFRLRKGIAKDVHHKIDICSTWSPRCFSSSLLKAEIADESMDMAEIRRVCVLSTLAWATTFSPPHKVPPTKCLESERLSSGNVGFPFSELAGEKVHDSYLSGTIFFYLSTFSRCHRFLLFPLLRGGNGIRPCEHNNLRGSDTVSLGFSGPPRATPGLHTPPAPPRALSALHRKFTTLWPDVKVPFRINTKAIKCS